MFKSLASILQNQVTAKGKNRNEKSYVHTDSFDFLKLIEAWPQIVGPQMAKHTIPLKIKNKSLYIVSDHPAFSSSMSFMDEAIKEKIFQAFPPLKSSIHKICYQVDNLLFTKNQKPQIVKKNKTLNQLHPYSPEYRMLKKEAEELLSSIQNAELKEELVSIFIQIRHQK